MATVIICKRDLSKYGLGLGIWEALTEGLPKDTEGIAVRIVGKAFAEAQGGQQNESKGKIGQ